MGVTWDAAVLHSRITARAVEGAANRARVLAWQMRSRCGVVVSLVAGERSREQLIEVICHNPASLDRLREP